MSAQTALPMRDYGSFLPGARRGRRGRALERLQLALLPQRLSVEDASDPALWRGPSIKELQLEDWGVTYDEIEHCYDRFEYVCGTSGKAGNLKGQIIEGGNPFEGPRAREYPAAAAEDAILFRACSRRRRRAWAFIPSPCPQATCPSPMSIRWAWRWANAPIAAIASASAAPIIPRQCRRPRFFRC